MPMFFIAMSGFCINDILDQEQDRINHPDRTLVKYPALSKSVVTTYVVLFIGSIITIALQQSPIDKFIWSIFFVVLSNYSFFKRTFPIIKNIYIAIAAIFPVSILDLAHDEDISSPYLYIPFVLSIFARELAHDISDIDGDGQTLASMLGPTRSWYFVVFIYTLVIISVYVLGKSNIDTISAFVGAIGLVLYVLTMRQFNFPEHSLIIISGSIVVVPAVLLIN